MTRSSGGLDKASLYRLDIMNHPVWRNENNYHSSEHTHDECTIRGRKVRVRVR